MFKDEQIKQLTAIEKFVTAFFEKDKTGHDLSHIKRVVKMAQKIAQEEQANLFLVTAAAWLHEMLDDKFFEDEAVAKTNLEQFLIENSFSDEEILQILSIIENQSFSKNIDSKQELALEGKVVQDADRLEALGAIGIARTFYYAGHKGNAIYTGVVDTEGLSSKKEYREKEDSAIQHFYDKLLLLKDLMNTPSGKSLAKKRHQWMKDYLEEFFEEWEVK
jgi:uncharacterized protein